MHDDALNCIGRQGSPLLDRREIVPAFSKIEDDRGARFTGRPSRYSEIRLGFFHVEAPGLHISRPEITECIPGLGREYLL